MTTTTAQSITIARQDPITHARLLAQTFGALMLRDVRVLQKQALPFVLRSNR